MRRFNESLRSRHNAQISECNLLHRQKMPSKFYVAEKQGSTAAGGTLKLPNPSQTEPLEHQSIVNIDFTHFTRDDKVKKNIEQASTTASQQAIVEARRIKRKHLQSARSQNRQSQRKSESLNQDLTDLRLNVSKINQGRGDETVEEVDQKDTSRLDGQLTSGRMPTRHFKKMSANTVKNSVPPRPPQHAESVQDFAQMVT